MKAATLLLWVLVALGLAWVVQSVGPYVVGGCVAFVLYRRLFRQP